MDVRTSPFPARARLARAARRVARFRALAVVALASGCTVPVAGGLDDPEANRVLLALESASVSASKEPDGASEGRWRIEV
ncbi:MAG: hypothetical protein JOZ69_07570, partial [Myxococcales bacterium]|nr:hypothetical protein [Myxococcales bacterium]